jgi:hypothetical protein
MRRPALPALALLAALLLVTPTAAGALDDRALDREVVELSAPTPDWYTAELHEQVLAAGPAGVPLPDEAQVPASALAFTGIRPGSWMISPSLCTMNFVFGGTSGGPGGKGKKAKGGIGNDFALVEIDPALQGSVNPSMAVIAGPTSTGEPAVGQVVEHVGHGLVIGTGGTPRAGLVTYVGDGDGQDPTAAYGWDGASTPGDSGSGVRAATGEAVGNLTHLVVGTEYLPAFIAGTSVSRMVQIAGLPVVCASLVPNPLPSDPGVPC